jgi:hypothetical protein
MEIRLVDAIRSLAGNITAFDINNGKISAWDTGEEPTNVKQPTELELATELARLQAEYDSQEYARKRKAKYDALNQFELISDDAINGTTTHKDAILAIKSEFPKP